MDEFATFEREVKKRAEQQEVHAILLVAVAKRLNLTEQEIADAVATKTKFYAAGSPAHEMVTRSLTIRTKDFLGMPYEDAFGNLHNQPGQTE